MKGRDLAQARRLERGLYPDVFPTYGELHAFTASSAEEPVRVFENGLQGAL